MMRISIVKGDPNFVADGKNYIVTIDGVVQTHCITADAEKGIALRYKRTILGTMCKNRRGKFITKEVHGVVTIERKPNSDTEIYISEEYKAELLKLKINDNMHGKFDTGLS